MAAKFYKKIKSNGGQAAIETALALPLIIFLIYYAINAYHSIHTGHIGQKYAAMNLYQRMDYRSKIVVDDLDNRLHGKDFMAVRYAEPSGENPKRKIISPNAPSSIVSIIGICKEPGCR
ncbi:MAG: pilus assembly protein [Deltaproteobacteria bacterium]|nr:pilus assembly protein [Deltaproteobacteria bacterium]